MAIPARMDSDILPPRTYETDDENALAAALNRMGDQALTMATAAAGKKVRRFSDLPPEAKRQRAIMKRSLEDAAQAAMAMLAHGLRPIDDKENGNGR